MHASVDKMGMILQDVFLFKKFRKTAEDVIRNCAFCLQTKPSLQAKPPIFPSRLHFYPRKTLSIDLVHISAALDNVVLTVIDLFSNFVIYIPIKKGYSSLTIAKTLIERVFTFFGSVKTLVTDNESTLISPLLVDIAMILNCKHFSMVPRQSTSQGRVELSNRLLLQARYFKTHTRITDQNLGMLCALSGHFLNSIKSPSMIASPYYIMFGSHPPDVLLTFASHKEFQNHSQYMEHLTLVQNMYFLVRDYHLNKGLKYGTPKTPKIEVGAFCLIKDHPNKTKPGWKLRNRYKKMPYRIVGVYKKSLLVTAFNKLDKHQKFLGRGKILKQHCKRVRIQDVKLLQNPNKILQLSVPMKLMTAFDQFLSNRELISKNEMDNIKMSKCPIQDNQNPLLPSKLLNNIQTCKSLFTGQYFYLPSKQVHPEHKLFKELRKKYQHKKPLGQLTITNSDISEEDNTNFKLEG